MPDPSWLQLTEAAEKWTSVAALVAGGVWAYYRFGLKREKETALDLDLTISCLPYGPDLYLVFFDVACTNKGGVQIVAKTKRPLAYEDPSEKLNYGVDLLLRRIKDDLAPGTELKWFATRGFGDPTVTDIEVDLLEEYERDGESHFWMEPGEQYHLSRGILLKPGKYIAKVTFIGNSSDDEFWRRLFLVTVPSVVDEASRGAIGPHNSGLNQKAPLRGDAG